MKKGYKIVIVICLVAMLLFCQNVTVIPQTTKYFDSHPSVGGLLLSTDIIYPCTPFFDKESLKNDFLKLPTRQFELNLPTAKVMPIRINIPSNVLQIVDIRSNIEKTIPQYFNGSKYKSISLNA